MRTVQIYTVVSLESHPADGGITMGGGPEGKAKGHIGLDLYEATRGTLDF